MPRMATIDKMVFKEVDSFVGGALTITLEMEVMSPDT